ncbi:DJ-1/PfpI family protein [Agrobacterium vitis]|uniref:DJ-1/PfpI family protein n=1 Tax=Agrobacterium vitis TaxID=373 RepID=A0AAE4W8X8_AGRVI|nr:DJ-1/PfpI family protein [Agrobacterium vitis]MCF1497826.1 DJ-1/PfpI family protein [Allorhizobium sp. Av2]MCM2438708.1 DJ-1/PfpI family protein [Agrobacterium vitis]MUZ55966.1 DJ-1/PfpI family protein [Agrobacterium vitis]MVA64896.1 DJ-1/PfpI family protein [Agrobacterium vitis]MVA85867.1 DJ-1/PfpI family protein [Agrobacterium vitis]
MSIRFGILCFPNVQQLDLTGPYEVFGSARDARVDLVWKNTAPVRASTGLWLTPDLTFEEAPAFDVICVPGGGGVNPLLKDEETLDFVQAQAKTARFVTSVCTGTLVLGQAGLLAGKRAATHWNAMDFLPRFGATAVEARVVRDGNLITAGGVTSGIDFGLSVIAELMGQDEAETIQLSLEYAPAPPFDAGLPTRARPEILAAARQRMVRSRQEREALISP